MQELHNRRGASPTRRGQAASDEDDENYGWERRLGADSEASEVAESLDELETSLVSSAENPSLARQLTEGRSRVREMITRMGSARSSARPQQVNPEVPAAAAGGPGDENVETLEMMSTVQSVVPFLILILAKVAYEHALSALGFLVLVRWRIGLDKRFTDQVGLKNEGHFLVVFGVALACLSMVWLFVMGDYEHTGRHLLFASSSKNSFGASGMSSDSGGGGEAADVSGGGTAVAKDELRDLIGAAELPHLNGDLDYDLDSADASRLVWVLGTSLRCDLVASFLCIGLKAALWLLMPLFLAPPRTQNSSNGSGGVGGGSGGGEGSELFSLAGHQSDSGGEDRTTRRLSWWQQAAAAAAVVNSGGGGAWGGRARAVWAVAGLLLSRAWGCLGRAFSAAATTTTTTTPLNNAQQQQQQAQQQQQQSLPGAEVEAAEVAHFHGQYDVNDAPDVAPTSQRAKANAGGGGGAFGARFNGNGAVLVCREEEKEQNGESASTDASEGSPLVPPPPRAPASPQQQQQQQEQQQGTPAPPPAARTPFRLFRQRRLLLCVVEALVVFYRLALPAPLWCRYYAGAGKSLALATAGPGTGSAVLSEGQRLMQSSGWPVFLFPSSLNSEPAPSSLSPSDALADAAAATATAAADAARTAADNERATRYGHMFVGVYLTLKTMSLLAHARNCVKLLQATAGPWLIALSKIVRGGSASPPSPQPASPSGGGGGGGGGALSDFATYSAYLSHRLEPPPPPRHAGAGLTEHHAEQHSSSLSRHLRHVVANALSDFAGGRERERGGGGGGGGGSSGAYLEEGGGGGGLSAAAPTTREAVLGDCPICFDALGDGTGRSPQTAVLEPCGHVFCEDCACEWLEREHTCPLCRAVVAAPDEEYRDALKAFHAATGATTGSPFVL